MAARLRILIRRHALLLATLGATVLVYARSLGFDHISWDDPDMVFRNPDVQHFNLLAFFTDHYVGNYIPVTMLLHGISWFLFGNYEPGHHFLSLLLHLANGILLYHLTQKIFQQHAVAALTAVIFLLHPMQVESVAWISELKTLLFSFFFLWGLLAYQRHLKEPAVKNYLFMLGLFVLACLSKPAAVVFPLAMVCIELACGKNPVRFLRNKIPFVLLAILFGLVNLYTQSEDRFINYAHAFPFPERVGYAGYALLQYIVLFFFPSNLSVIYPYPRASAFTLVTGYVVIVLLLALAGYMWRRERRTLLPCLLFFLVNLVLVLQLIPFGEALYADRYMYIAAAGPGWIVATLVARLRIHLRFAVAGALVALAVLTFARAQKWKSALTLYEDIVRKYPDNFVALNSAGAESMFTNDDRKALAYFREAVKAAPDNYKGYYNLGLLFLKKQDPDEAIRQFNSAISLYEYAKAYTGRATAFHLKGDLSKAVHDAERAIALEPDHAKAYFVLGNCYSDMNDHEKALKNFDRAISLDPNEAEFYFKRAIVKGKQQQFAQCATDLKEALRLRPGLYEAHYWLGVAMVNLSQDPCPHFLIAARNNFEPAVRAYNKMCR